MILSTFIHKNWWNKLPDKIVAGKKVKGRKRNILVDTMDLLLIVWVHAAKIQDMVRFYFIAW